MDLGKEQREQLLHVLGAKGGMVTNSCILDWHSGTSGMFSHGISQGIEEALMTRVIQEKNLGIKGQSRVFGVHLDR